MILAIEGTSFAGKSTLIKGLTRYFGDKDFVYYSCYVKALRAKQLEIPDGLPSTVQEQGSATKLFLDEVEKDRYQQKLLNTNAKVFVLDRSIHTLQAHPYVLEKYYNYPGASEITKRLLFQHTEKLIPDYTIFLNVPQEALEARFPLSIERTLFMSEQYNNCFKSYFHFKTGNENILIIEGAKTIPETLELAKIHISKLLNAA